MKTILIALALLACCTAFVPGEFRNLTTTEINYNSHVQSLIPSSLKEVLKINDVDNQFNTTDFILDKINFVSQREFSDGYIYKINVDFLNSADEIAQTQFIGTYNAKMKKLSIPSLSYDIKYPKIIEEEDVFIPSPINGTHSLGIYKHLRNYLNENFNSTYGISGNTTMFNNTYIPLENNKTEDYSWRNNTSMTFNNTSIDYNNTNKTEGYNWRNNTSMAYNNRTNSSEISSANITDFVYTTLNTLVDRFNNTMNSDNSSRLNKTSNNVTEIDLTELEPILDDFFKFVTKGVEETFGLSLKEVMTTLLNLGDPSEALHDVAETLHDVADELENIFA